MKSQEIYELMDRFEARDIARLKLSQGDTTLELEKYPAAQGVPASVASEGAVVSAAPVLTSAASVAPASASDSASAPAAASVPASEPAPAPAEDLPCITAPLVGTFYAAPEPGKPAYVQPGDHVKQGDTVCLLEAMKMMSEVPAPCDCVIEEVVPADGELVSFGAPLIRYREA